jgi:hypothetical protein
MPQLHGVKGDVLQACFHPSWVFSFLDHSGILSKSAVAHEVQASLA